MLSLGLQQAKNDLPGLSCSHVRRKIIIVYILHQLHCFEMGISVSLEQNYFVDVLSHINALSGRDRHRLKLYSSSCLSCI